MTAIFTFTDDSDCRSVTRYV